jgi:hypothetical protein
MGDNQLLKNNSANGVTRQVTQLSDEMAGLWKEEFAFCRYCCSTSLRWYGMKRAWLTSGPRFEFRIT